MGWFSIWLARIIGLTIAKKNSITTIEIETTRKKIIATHRLYSIKSLIQSNLDLKPAILRLFFLTYWIDGIFLAFSIIANMFYTWLFLVLEAFKIKISGAPETPIRIPWIGILIINLLVILFFIRWISDYYKLSLRDKYRNNYLKLLWLDIITLNLFSVIGSLIFLKNKKSMINVNLKQQEIKHSNLNSETIKNFSKISTKIELLILLFNLILIILAIPIGYFVSVNIIKWICASIIFLTFTFLQAWSLQKITGLIIVRKMLKNLLIDENYYLLLIIIRFLGFNFGVSYMTVFISILKLDENYQEFIIQQW
ncbi:hypothetical protein LT335_00179 [Spiroplasma sp. JKS002669]|uniref:hypothetical protein n=1 Tax=Spiroplasma attinicola TaxID=2904537 RepID=UPI0020BF3A2A|nr:hypothetical protein [Spiroplasma sp. JKS002669]MCL6428640.1 hypothetical protein [Spiroplasma sp. JKS002669]